MIILKALLFALLIAGLAYFIALFVHSIFEYNRDYMHNYALWMNGEEVSQILHNFFTIGYLSGDHMEYYFCMNGVVFTSTGAYTLVDGEKLKILEFDTWLIDCGPLMDRAVEALEYMKEETYRFINHYEQQRKRDLKNIKRLEKEVEPWL